jgi:hypothetical protein
LDKAGSNGCFFVRADNLASWLKDFQGVEGYFTADSIDASEWNFPVGRGASVFLELQAMPLKLKDVATRIYQGPITSADSIFLFKDCFATRQGVATVGSKELEEQVDVEAGILKKVVRSGDIGPFWAKPEALVLFPYEVEEDEARLLTSRELADRFPLAWEYLKRNRKVLEDREDGKFKDSEWYRFGRTQNLGLWEQSKLMVPYMITRLGAYLDVADHYYFINVTTGGYGITTQSAKCSLPLLCALMNSPVLDFVFKRVSTTFHGGYFAANRQYIDELPIASATEVQEVLVTKLVEYLHWLNRYLHGRPDAGTARDALMSGYWEQLLNGLVYELYYPEELHKRGLHIFELTAQAELPQLDSLSEGVRLERFRSLFETIYDNSHPIRGALHSLRSLEVVRIIEAAE